MLAIGFYGASNGNDFTRVIVDSPEAMLAGEINWKPERVPFIVIVSKGRYHLPAFKQVTTLGFRIEKKTSYDSAFTLESLRQGKIGRLGLQVALLDQEFLIEFLRFAYIKGQGIVKRKFSHLRRQVFPLRHTISV